MEDTITIVDGEERAVQHPKTFRIPTKERREGVRRGQLAKVLFETSVPCKEGRFKGATGERMWVRIASVKIENGKVSFAGHLTNVPAFLPMKRGDGIAFEPRHVIDIDDDTFPRQPLDADELDAVVKRKRYCGAVPSGHEQATIETATCSRSPVHDGDHVDGIGAHAVTKHLDGGGEGLVFARWPNDGNQRC